MGSTMGLVVGIQVRNMTGSFVRRWGRWCVDRMLADQCARWGGEGMGDYTTGVIRPCRGTRPGDALRPNRQPQKPRTKPPQNAMCLGSCSRSPDGWPGWPIAACARHARFRLNDRPAAGLHGGPSASCGYAPAVQVQGSPARVDRLINHHFRQNPHGLLSPLRLSPSALGMDASRSTSLPAALRVTFVSIWLLHLALALPNFRELGPTIPNEYYGLHPDPRQCRDKRRTLR